MSDAVGKHFNNLPSKEPFANLSRPKKYFGINQLLAICVLDPELFDKVLSELVKLYGPKNMVSAVVCLMDTDLEKCKVLLNILLAIDHKHFDINVVRFLAHLSEKIAATEYCQGVARYCCNYDPKLVDTIRYKIGIVAAALDGTVLSHLFEHICSLLKGKKDDECLGLIKVVVSLKFPGLIDGVITHLTLEAPCGKSVGIAVKLIESMISHELTFGSSSGEDVYVALARKISTYAEMFADQWDSSIAGCEFAPFTKVFTGLINTCAKKSKLPASESASEIAPFTASLFLL